MQAEAVLTLLALASAASWTPGPNNAMLANSGATFGLRRTLPHVCGVALGAGLMVCLVGLFLGAVFQQSTILREGLRYVGALLLLWVAWKIGSSGGIGARSGTPRPFRFHEAMAFQWINPKAWVMAISLSSQFIEADAPVRSAAIVGLCLVLVGFGSAMTWASAGMAMRRFLTTGRRLRIFNVAMGLVIVLGVVFLLLE